VPAAAFSTGPCYHPNKSNLSLRRLTERGPLAHKGKEGSSTWSLTGTGAFGVSLSGRPGIRTEWLLGLVWRLLLLLLSVRLVSSCILGLTVKSSDGLQKRDTNKSSRAT